MKGARRYAEVFKNCQHGRLYFVSGRHARGRTFSIYVLPEGEEAIIKYNGHPPANKDAVEVYGMKGGQRGWTEYYGWLHRGRWVDDFAKIYDKRIVEILNHTISTQNRLAEEEQSDKKRKSKLLEGY